MIKKENLGMLAIHLCWALGWSIGAYYVEYGIILLFGRWGMDKVISGTVAGGAVLFLVFYLIERKLIEEEVTKKGIYIFSTYVLPIIYQGTMIYFVAHSIQDETGVVGSMFILTLTLLIMGLSFRGMLEMVNFYRTHIRVKRN